MTTSIKRNKHALQADVEKIKDHFSEASEDIKNLMQAVYHQSLENVKDKSITYKDNVSGYVSEHPFRTIGISTACGLLVGLLLRRK